VYHSKQHIFFLKNSVKKRTKIETSFFLEELNLERVPCLNKERRSETKRVFFFENEPAQEHYTKERQLKSVPAILFFFYYLI